MSRKRRKKKLKQTKNFLETAERLSNQQLLEQITKRKLITDEELENIKSRVEKAEIK